MAVSPVYAVQDGWRAEDAIRDIFEFERDEPFNPQRMTCLAWVKAGNRRCTYFDAMQKSAEKFIERRQLASSFLDAASYDDPMNFKSAVMRYIELAVCHKYHINKMQVAAEDWFDERARAAARPTVSWQSASNAVPGAIRHYSTSPTNNIKMRPYIRGRDAEQLRMLIEEPLDWDDCKEGQLYITVSSDVPGYIKIGYTTQLLQQRFTYASRDCDIDIQPMYTTGFIPHAKRLEGIVHNELAEKRYRFADPCQFCLMRPGKRHEEWFLTTVEYARGVAEYWKTWLLRGMYDKQMRYLAPHRREEVWLSASPESIKARERSLSPEYESTNQGTASLSQGSPPESPTPKPRAISQRLAEPKHYDSNPEDHGHEDYNRKTYVPEDDHSDEYHQKDSNSEDDHREEYYIRDSHSKEYQPEDNDDENKHHADYHHGDYNDKDDCPDEYYDEDYDAEDNYPNEYYSEDNRSEEYYHENYDAEDDYRNEYHSEDNRSEDYSHEDNHDVNDPHANYHHEDYNEEDDYPNEHHSQGDFPEQYQPEDHDTDDDHPEDNYHEDYGTDDVGNSEDYHHEHHDTDNDQPEHYDPEDYDSEGADPEDSHPENRDPEDYDSEDVDPEDYHHEDHHTDCHDTEDDHPEDYGPEDYDSEDLEPRNSEDSSTKPSSSLKGTQHKIGALHPSIEPRVLRSTSLRQLGNSSAEVIESQPAGPSTSFEEKRSEDATAKPSHDALIARKSTDIDLAAMNPSLESQLSSEIRTRNIDKAGEYSTKTGSSIESRPLNASNVKRLVKLFSAKEKSGDEVKLSAKLKSKSKELSIRASAKLNKGAQA